MQVKTLEAFQIEYFIKTLEHFKGKREPTAKALSWSRKSIYNWAEKAKAKGYKSRFLGDYSATLVRDDDFIPEPMVKVTIEYLIDVLTYTRGIQIDAARLLGVHPKTISNYTKMAEFEGVKNEFLGYRAEKQGPPRISDYRMTDISDIICHEMPTNEERLHYLNNPHAKGYNKQSFQK